MLIIAIMLGYRSSLGSCSGTSSSRCYSKSPCSASLGRPLPVQRRQLRCSALSLGPEVTDTLSVALASSSQIGPAIQAAVDSLAASAPGPLQAGISMVGGDVAAVAMLAPTFPGMARLSVSLV